MSAAPLTFAALDGLAFAATRGRLRDLPSEPAYAADALGPFLEFTQLGACGLLPRPDQAAWLALGSVSGFEAALRSGRREWICPASRAAGFFRTGRQWSEDETPWVGFA